MTDNEIIKALELCATLDSRNCKKCPCREICKENDGTLTKLILDLINRQKAEIERLKKNIDGLNIFTKNHIKVIRLQAIKEFAEYIIDKSQNSIIQVSDIPDYVKKMTEQEC